MNIQIAYPDLLLSQPADGFIRSYVFEIKLKSCTTQHIENPVVDPLAFTPQTTTTKKSTSQSRSNISGFV